MDFSKRLATFLLARVAHLPCAQLPHKRIFL